MKTTKFAQESAAQAEAEAHALCLNDYLNMLDNHDVSERQRWWALKIILREFMLGQGIDLDEKFNM